MANDPPGSQSTAIAGPASPAYQSLRDCASRRLADWLLPDNCLAALRLIVEFSYGCDQMWACIPSHNYFVALCGLHKSTVSRTLQKLRKMGLVDICLRKEETLYHLNLHATGIPMRSTSCSTATDNADAIAKLRAELYAIQQRRDQGRNDPNGQMRLRRVIVTVPEDLNLETEAFQAMLEHSPEPHPPGSAGVSPASVTTIPIPTTTARSEQAVSPIDDQETEAYLDSLFADRDRAVAAMQHATPTQQSKTKSSLKTKTKTDRQNVIAEGEGEGIEPDDAEELTQSIIIATSDDLPYQDDADVLLNKPTHWGSKCDEVWRMLVTEMRYGSREGWAGFTKFERYWRNQVRDHPQAVYEGIANHALMRSTRGPAKLPGKIIAAGMKAALNPKTQTQAV